jgi:hypothetical protein
LELRNLVIESWLSQVQKRLARTGFVEQEPEGEVD